MSTEPSAQELRRTLHELAQRLGADPSELPSLGPTPIDAAPYLHRAADETWHLRVLERGRLTVDRPLPGEELLYVVAVDLAGRVAARHQLTHRGPGDPRRVLFAQQYAALQRVNPVWADRWRAGLAAEFIRIGQPRDVDLLPRGSADA